MNISEMITQLQALQAKVGDCEVVLNKTGGHLDRVEKVTGIKAVHRVDLGPGSKSMFRHDCLATGGYGGRGAFMEPVQSQLTAAPAHNVVLLESW